jgi:hypothetical protein
MTYHRNFKRIWQQLNKVQEASMHVSTQFKLSDVSDVPGKARQCFFVADEIFYWDIVLPGTSSSIRTSSIIYDSCFAICSKFFITDANGRFCIVQPSNAWHQGTFNFTLRIIRSQNALEHYKPPASSITVQIRYSELIKGLVCWNYPIVQI